MRMTVDQVKALPIGSVAVCVTPQRKYVLVRYSKLWWTATILPGANNDVWAGKGQAWRCADLAEYDILLVAQVK